VRLLPACRWEEELEIWVGGGSRNRRWDAVGGVRILHAPFPLFADLPHRPVRAPKILFCISFMQDLGGSLETADPGVVPGPSPLVF
jgi:hypothetical protein